jgi:D-tyrosyl-tRNA(Tyr) deacylase
MNRSVRDLGGEALVVPQFTLYADTSRGRRPGFEAAAAPRARRARVAPLLRRAAGARRSHAGRAVGASMEVELVNRGPATFLLETTDG